MTQQPQGLRIDSGGDQFPVSGPAPRLSWLPVAGAGRYRLEAEVDGEAQTQVEVDGHRFVPWPWAPLGSARRVRWRVRTGDAVSDWHAFESGLFEADWTAEWISPVETGNEPFGQRPAYTLSTDFEAREGVRSARLYSTALGVYEAFVNGVRVGTAELSPGSTSYDRTLYAQAAAAAVLPGANRIEVLLSDGWVRGEVGAFREPAGWDGPTGVRLELHVAYEDGTRQVVRSDGSWTSHRSQVVRAGLMDGQTVDLQAPQEDPVPVLTGRAEAPPVDWSPAPPVRVVETRPAVSLKQIDDGTWIADFGQNASGWIALSDLGPSGTRTVIEYGEHLGPDGDLTTAHLDATSPEGKEVVFRQRDEVVSSGAPGVFEPRHTVHGFQYARITRDAPLNADAVAMRVVHSDLAPAGDFACSDDDLNRLHEVAKWSFRGNAVDIPTDCPTRERIGWTGDYQVFAPTATRLYDVLGFSRKWLRSVRDDQWDDGRIASFSPDGRRTKLNPQLRLAMMTGSAGWADAIVLVPWELYTAYGDSEVLAENWEAMVRWVEWALGNAASARHASRIERSAEPLPHERYLWDGSFHWGEWCEPKPKGPDGKSYDPIQVNPTAWFTSDKGEIGTAYLYRSTSVLARIAGLLGRAEEAARYGATAARVLDAWRTEFLDEHGHTAVDNQPSYVRALHFGLIPDELRERAVDRLAALIREADTHLTTGFLATADLLPVLADHGRADLAYELLFQRTEPSWLGMLDRGATTIWENWDGVDEDGEAHESLNHYSKGAVIRFLHTHTLGLRQDEDSAAWESFTVAPFPHASLTWARGHLDTPQGTIRVDWAVEGGELALTVEVPPGTSATMALPDGTTRTAAPGVHRAACRLDEGH